MIIFAHQGKTGGTTLVKGFKDTYGKENVFRDHDVVKYRMTPAWQRILMQLMEPFTLYLTRRKYYVIHGHFFPEKYCKIFPKAFYMTIYRHPVQRVISVYNYWLRKPKRAHDHPLCRWLREEKPGIVEFAGKSEMEEKKENLKSFDPGNFDFIGITERYEETLKMLKICFPELNIDIVKPQRVNPEKKPGELYQLPNADGEKLEKILSARIDLYNKALRRFEADLRANGL